MDQNIIQTAPVGHSVAAKLSMWDLFLGADWVVQGVMVMLMMASLWCWTIIFAKAMRLRSLKRQADVFEEIFWSGGSLDHLYDRVGSRPNDPMSAVFSAAMRELRRTVTKSRGKDVSVDLQQRVERVMMVTVTRELEDLERHLNFLASVGSTAPFVGLFGTVWGIMNSFQGIAQSQSTNLAVVAPGIAEALFATAIGLLAAIPAVLAYNKLSTTIAQYASRLDVFVQEFSSVISRQMEDGE